jgi:hypothetical protein
MATIDLGNGAKCIIDDDGNKWWYLNNQFHRADGPACEHADGSKFWYLNDKLHRIDGPAVELAYGERWYINGKQYSEEDFNVIKEVLWAI